MRVAFVRSITYVTSFCEAESIGKIHIFAVVVVYPPQGIFRISITREKWGS